MNKWNFEIIDHIPSDVAPHHVFFHPSIIDAWVKTYTPLRNMRVFNVKAEKNNTVVYMPLVLWRKNWRNAFLRSIGPIGYSDYDYHDPIISGILPEEDIESYWSELFEYLRLHFCPDEIVIDGITDSFIGKDFTKGEICPLLNLERMESEDDLMAFFKTSLRGDIRRQIRRLSELGELSYQEYKSWDDISPETFSEFMNQHSARWPNAYKAPHFHENLLKLGLKAGTVHFSTLSVAGKEIAWHLGFSFDGRYYYYMPAGNQEYFKYSPTKVHLFYLVRRAVEMKCKIFDHLRGEENYKSGWSDQFQYVNTLKIDKNAFSTYMKREILKLKAAITPPPP